MVVVTVRSAVAVVIAPSGVGATEAKSIEAGRLMPTEVPVLESVTGVPDGGLKSAAFAYCGNDGNNIKPNINVKAQQLIIPASLSHNIRLNLL